MASVWRESENNGVNMSDLSDDFAAMRTRTPLSPTPQPATSFIQTAPRAQTFEEFQEQYATWNILYAANLATAGLPPQPPAVAPYTSPRNRPLPQTPTTPLVNLTQAPRIPAINPYLGLHQNGSRLGKSIATKPDVFTGDKTKFRDWMQGVKWYLMGFDDVPSNRQSILITLSYMKGNNPARRYANLFAETKSIDMMFDDFEKDLVATFQLASLKRDAEKELLGLKQKKDQLVEDYFTYMHQLMLRAEYDENTHASLLVYTAHHRIHNEIVEFVERGQPLLLELEHLGRWEKALIHADNTLKDIASRKRGSSSRNTRFFTPRSSYPTTQGTMAPTASTSTGASTASVHPNAPGSFGGMGVPMDLAKARAKGKCQRCGKPWPCKEHFKPRINLVRTLKFRGVMFSYSTDKELEEKLEKIESDFVEGSQL